MTRSSSCSNSAQDHPTLSARRLLSTTLLVCTHTIKAILNMYSNTHSISNNSTRNSNTTTSSNKILYMPHNTWDRRHRAQCRCQREQEKVSARCRTNRNTLQDFRLPSLLPACWHNSRAPHSCLGTLHHRAHPAKWGRVHSKGREECRWEVCSRGSI